jgi:S-DNA-T family DNA segregation ATPase FtsK/SpoIIIE
VVGSGTTTALASLGLAFCATRSPDQGHLYVLDFGSGALSSLEGLPHCGAVIPVTDRERQIRLIRYLRNEMERRRKLGPDGRAQLSTILVLIDNVEAFRAEYEDAYGLGVIEQALRLFADGPDAGIYLAATATRLGGVPAALSSATPQKLVLRLSDASDYGAFSISRKQLPTFAPGRGLMASTAQVVQVAMPAPDLRAAVEEVARTAPARVSSGPTKIGALPPQLQFGRLDQTGDAGSDAWRLPVGLSDEDLGTARLVLYEHEHALVAGPARSGRSTTLLTVARALRDIAPGATVVGIACRRSPLRGHPLLDRVAESPDEIARVVDSALVASGPTLVLVDDCDSLDDNGGRLAQLLSAGRPDLHLAAAGRADVLRTMYGHWSQVLRRSKAGVLLQPNLELDGELLGARLPRRLATDLPAGRGFLVGDGRVEMVQIAQPGSEVDGQPAAGRRG